MKYLLNLQKAFKENFSVKVFSKFILCIITISSVFTAFFIFQQRRTLTDNLIKKGEMIAELLADSSRLGVFAENKDLLMSSTEGYLHHDEVISLSVFTLEGKPLIKQEKEGSRKQGKGMERDPKELRQIIEKFKKSDSPFHLVRPADTLEFWAPVTSGPKYFTDEDLFFEQTPLSAKDSTIGFVGVTLDRSILNKQLETLLYKGILIGIAFLIIGSIVTYTIAKRVTKPLNKLTEGVKVLGKGGHVEKVSVETKDEIGRLAHAFNTMVKELKQSDKSLKDSEEKFRNLAEQSPNMIFINKRGSVVYANRKCEEIMGYLKEEFYYPDFNFLDLIAPEFKDLVRDNFGRHMEGEEVAPYEYALITKDGKRIEVILATKLITYEGDKAILGTVTDITERKLAEEKLRSSREQLRSLTTRLSEAEEGERQNLARELHDQLGQNLTALGINLKIVQSNINGEVPELVISRLEDSMELINQLTQYIRNIMADLRPSVLDDYGLLAAFRWYGQQFSERTNIAVVIQGQELVPRLPPAVEMALFRITQEVFTNVAKHAQASKITLLLEETTEKVQLTILDDGKGFDLGILNEVAEKKGWGLVTIKERAEALGGYLDVGSERGKGTKVVVEVRR